MLYPKQKLLANLTGGLIGLIALTFVLMSNAPTKADAPSIGASITMDAWVGGGVQPTPLAPKTFISASDLQSGATPATGNLTIENENGTPATITLGIDTETKTEMASKAFARVVEISFGENGSIGSSTLASLAKAPISPFTLEAGETKVIPVSVAIPLSAGDQAAGQKIDITLIPEKVR